MSRERETEGTNERRAPIARGPRATAPRKEGPSKRDRAQIAEQVARESERRARLGVPAAAAGVLYLLSGIILTTTLKELPTVGLLQGVAPALRGEPNPAVSPRAAEVRFIDHHAFGLIAGGVLAAIAVAALTVVLLSCSKRSASAGPDGPAAQPTVLVGGVGMALIFAVRPVVQVLASAQLRQRPRLQHTRRRPGADPGYGPADRTSSWVCSRGSPRRGDVIAVMGAGAHRPARALDEVLGIFAGLLRSPRSGGIRTLQDLIPTFWLVAMGIMLMGAGRTRPARLGRGRGDALASRRQSAAARASASARGSRRGRGARAPPSLCGRPAASGASALHAEGRTLVAGASALYAEQSHARRRRKRSSQLMIGEPLHRE